MKPINLNEQIKAGRRNALKACGLLGAAAFGPICAAQPLVFDAPGPNQEQDGSEPEDISAAFPRTRPPADLAVNDRPAATPQQSAPPQLGVIAPDFWQKPRTLRLYRSSSKEHVSVTYWRDGAIDPTGYWAACALLRDTHANRMTSIDPALLDILRGMLGFYEAWGWPYPLVVNSGFRTVETNNRLLVEGAARNSLHLYGKAADIYIPGVPIRDVGRLAQHFQRGGVGFYVSKSFVHVDTGVVRAWAG